jgi:hypothetical protein
MMKNPISLITGLLLTFTTVVLAQPPWDIDTLDYNHLVGQPVAQFDDTQEQLNATRYYQFGRDAERHPDKTWTTIRRVMDFETGKFFDLRTSNQNFPRRHMDTLNMKSISNGEFGQGDWRNLYRPWTGTMSSTGVFTETTAEQLHPQEKSYWK